MMEISLFMKSERFALLFVILRPLFQIMQNSALLFPVTIIILRLPLSLSLRFEKPPAPSRLDNVTASEDLFSGALPSLNG